MSWYRRTKPFLVTSRRNIITSPRISPVSPPSNAFSTVHRNGSSNLSAKFSGFSIFSRKSGLSLCNSIGNTNINACNRFLSIPRKFVSFDSRQVHPFKPPEQRRWFRRPAAVLMAVLVCSGVLVTVYCMNLETVPYTKRRHFVLWPKSIEKWLDESSFQSLTSGYEGKILPADHPESIRVKSIVKNIIQGMQRSLSLESVRAHVIYTENDGLVKDAAMGLSENCVEGTMSGMKGSEDDIWIQKCRKVGREKGSQPAISHLEGLNWEVIVVKGSAAKAYGFSFGKIVLVPKP
ncbi:PREDICTED: uncharacterized protein LOC104825077 [Tarenaya hassleriana]|uniref:uncharacterized protein LOC104825077 n=1 Tax=Tarenaya hassleriana TaxID=28532 RepID=UPI0008FCE689|nr:PREDICTED: uncharacterized protein LOC104825077 [Tarenaya hassleriana]